jgi:hypothetical protein
MSFIRDTLFCSFFLPLRRHSLGDQTRPGGEAPIRRLTISSVLGMLLAGHLSCPAVAKSFEFPPTGFSVTSGTLETPDEAPIGRTRAEPTITARKEDGETVYSAAEHGRKPHEVTGQSQPDHPSGDEEQPEQ